MHEGHEGERGASLEITEPAIEEIRRRLEDYEGDDELAFFVVTRPSRLGFNIGVGFEPVSSDRPLRDEYGTRVQISDEDLVRLRGFTIDVRDDQFVTISNVTVHVVETPNPDTLKFMVNRDVVTKGGATFGRPVQETDPILARFLLELPGIKSIFLIGNFCTVTRAAGAAWDQLSPEVGKRLQAYFAHGGDPVEPPARDLSTLSEVEQKVIRILQDVVQPAVHQHGGDIAFAGYEEGVVEVYLLGSCMGCPSALATLKMGVEQLLKEQVPEIREVVAIT